MKIGDLVHLKVVYSSNVKPPTGIVIDIEDKWVHVLWPNKLISKNRIKNLWRL